MASILEKAFHALTAQAVLGIVLGLVTVTANAFCENAAEDYRSLMTLLSEDPEVLARQALQKRRFEYLAVDGFAITVPGLDKSAVACVLKRNQFHLVPGIHEILCGNAQRKVREATTFAERYNVTLQKGIGDDPTVCGATQR
jgi:hypothetical protein